MASIALVFQSESVIEVKKTPRKPLDLDALALEKAMRRRRIAITSAVLVGLTASAMISIIILQKRPIISMERYERLTKGMTLKDVAALLGGPPGDYRTEDVFFKFMAIPPPEPIWIGNECAIEPHFDADGRMEFATYYGGERMTTFSLPWHRRIWNQIRKKTGI